LLIEIIDNSNSFEMKKSLLPGKMTKQHSLNCRIGRFFTLSDQHNYGRNASATAKSAFVADAAGIIRAGSHCRIKPLIH
jgi:hypothetical protein